MIFIGCGKLSKAPAKMLSGSYHSEYEGKEEIQHSIAAVENMLKLSVKLFMTGYTSVFKYHSLTVWDEDTNVLKVSDMK